jgi:tetratricopeptide (TPR) repeat protein
LIIYESLKNYNFLFENKRIPSNNSTFSNLSLISMAFQSCYLGEKQTQSYFFDLINNNEVDYSRYIFFYINNLIKQNKFQMAKDTADQIDLLNSSLLIMQTKNWIDNKKLEKFTEIFSCKDESNILSEFFYLIASLYSSQNDFEKSNFYINISNFLNPKFKFNLSLLAENYYKNNDYKKTENILNNFNENDDIYYWYKIKKKASIISNELGIKESLNFINSKFKKIKNPSLKILFDMANITKGFEEYETSIVYYNKVLSKISLNSESRAEILYRRGSCYERLGQFEKSDKDLLNSLEINPNDAYVLNYLAYSWLERNYKIDTSITMLEKAYKQKKNDPYILDSVGWAYYLVGDLIKAEQFLRKSIKIMPDDPIVNDHYGDILWAMNRKTQAKYYWQSVLNFENTEDDMKEKINIKLLKGPKKI